MPLQAAKGVMTIWLVKALRETYDCLASFCMACEYCASHDAQSILNQMCNFWRVTFFSAATTAAATTAAATLALQNALENASHETSQCLAASESLYGMCVVQGLMHRH